MRDVSAALVRLNFVGDGRFRLSLLSRSLSSKGSSSSFFSSKEEGGGGDSCVAAACRPLAKHWVYSRYTSSPFHRTTSASTT